VASSWFFPSRNYKDDARSNKHKILISGKIIKEMPGSVASGTHCIIFHTCNLISTKVINNSLETELSYIYLQFRSARY